MSLRELILIVALIEGLLHFLPWRLWLGRELPRLAAYTLGLLGMMVPFSLWLMDRGEIEIMQTLWIVIISAGATVFALYGLDHYFDLEKHKIESTQREQVMSRSLKGKDDGTGK